MLRRPLFLLCLSLIGWLMPAPALADIMVLRAKGHDAATGPLADVLPALKVQLPAVVQRDNSQPLPEASDQRVLLAKSILQETPKLRLVLWLAPEDVPFDGQGPYSLTVVRRLPHDTGLEQVRVDADTGPSGARTAALRVAELYRSAAPGAPASVAKDTSDAEPPTEPPTEPPPREPRWLVTAGAELRFDPRAELVQAGPSLHGRYSLDAWHLATGLLAAYHVPISWRAGKAQGSLQELDAAWTLRWLREHPWAIGAEVGAGIRAVFVEGEAFDGFRGSAANVSPWLFAHGVLAWQPENWSLLASAGFDFTPVTQRYDLDARPVIELSPWAPSARLAIGRSF